MKIKQIYVGVGYTWCPEPYHPIKAAFQVVADVEEGDDIEAQIDELQLMVRKNMIEQLKATYTTVHTPLYSEKGFDEINPVMEKSVEDTSSFIGLDLDSDDFLG